VDVTDAPTVTAAVRKAGLVLTTVGPFVRLGRPVLDACLDAGVHYVDVANELMAVRAVLDRDAEAKARGITAVTGAGFGPAGSESLVLGLVDELGETPDRVRVATAPAGSHASPGVRETIAALMPEGATTYVDGSLVRAPFGTGAATLEFGGVRRSMFPGPAGDLETARLASGAANVSAYFADPGQRIDDDFSYAYAEVVAASGRRLTAEARVGDGAPPGAFTPGRLFGKDLFAAVTGASLR
jgi:saccharopine dehydrogenase (NAD+, L-lysine-forming)